MKPIVDYHGNTISKQEAFTDLFKMPLVAVGELHWPNPDAIKHEIPARAEVDHVRDRGWWAK